MSVVLLLGSTGLLGAAIRARLQKSPDIQVIGAAREARAGSDYQVDISNDQALTNLLDDVNPDQVINCAALASIDSCETHPLEAWCTNARPLLTISDWSRNTGNSIVHISTDHYYSGDADKAHSESNDIELKHVYSETKFAGEVFALSAPQALVIRTSIIGFKGWGAKTFLEWAWNVVENDEEASLFADAYSSSLDVHNFASKALELANLGCRGLYNLGSSEVYSKEDFVLELARQRGRKLSNTRSGSINELQVQRGNSLGLDVSKASSALACRLPTLREVVSSILEQRLN